MLQRENADAVAVRTAALSPRERDASSPTSWTASTRVAGRRVGHEPRSRRRPAQPGPGEAAGRVPAGSGAASRPDRPCRPVLLALSSGDRRRQARSTPATTCSTATTARRSVGRCSIAAPGPRRRGHESPSSATPTWSRPARQAARSPPGPASRPRELTVIATAISEVARNIVRFAERGEIVVVADRRGRARRRDHRRPGRRPRDRRCRARPEDGYTHLRRSWSRAPRLPTADGRVRRSAPRSAAAPRSR